MLKARGGGRQMMPTHTHMHKDTGSGTVGAEAGAAGRHGPGARKEAWR